jgi:hypothetical protein
VLFIEIGADGAWIASVGGHESCLRADAHGIKL